MKHTIIFGYKDYEPLNSKVFDLEVRFSVRNWQSEYITFAVSGLFGFINGEETSVLKSSFGCGMNYKFIQKEQIFSGLYMFLYPIYGFPVIPFNKKLITDWRIALDIGFSLPFQMFNFSYYFRSDFVWFKDNFILKPDFGLSIGMYL